MAPMTPDRIAVVHAWIDRFKAADEYQVATAEELRAIAAVFTDLLAALATAEAEGRRQGVKDAYKAISADMATALQHPWTDESRKDAALGALNAIYVRVRQLLPEAPQR